MTSQFSVYPMHGLRIRSDLALGGPAVASEVFDVEVRWGSPRSVSNEPPPGEPIIDLVIDDRLWYSVSGEPTGYLLRYPGLCDFAISSDLRSVICHPDHGVEKGFIPILVTGGLVSLLLSLQGHHVLHASAVAVGGGAIAFAGTSGMGKSTCAALLCSAGAHLVSDDVLRVQLDPARCYRGASTIRLRPAAASIVDLFGVAPATTETVDGRIAVAALPSTDDLPLVAIVVPAPRRDISSIELEPLDGSEAFWLVASSGRLLGWRDAEMVRQQFAHVGGLVGQVPVVRAHIPWGPPFLEGTAQALIEALATTVGGASTAGL